jgi:hypothetical protein
MPALTYHRQCRTLPTPALWEAGLLDGPVRHPVKVVHNPRNVHLMVSRHTAGTIKPVDRLILMAVASPLLSPKLTNFHFAFADLFWKRIMEEEYEVLLIWSPVLPG